MCWFEIREVICECIKESGSPDEHHRIDQAPVFHTHFHVHNKVGREAPRMKCVTLSISHLKGLSGHSVAFSLFDFSSCCLRFFFLCVSYDLICYLVYFLFFIAVLFT